MPTLKELALQKAESLRVQAQKPNWTNGLNKLQQEQQAKLKALGEEIRQEVRIKKEQEARDFHRQVVNATWQKELKASLQAHNERLQALCEAGGMRRDEARAKLLQIQVQELRDLRGDLTAQINTIEGQLKSAFGGARKELKSKYFLLKSQLRQMSMAPKAVLMEQEEVSLGQGITLIRNLY